MIFVTLGIVLFFFGLLVVLLVLAVVFRKIPSDPLSLFLGILVFGLILLALGARILIRSFVH